jgi:hypothetical protein
MQSVFSILCKAANTTDEGYVNILSGGIGGYYVEKFPDRVAACAYVARFIMPREDARTFDVNIRFEGPDGETLIDFGTYPVKFTARPDDPSPELGASIVLSPYGLPLTKAGRHRFVVTHEGKEVTSASFGVIHVPKHEEERTIK